MLNFFRMGQKGRPSRNQQLELQKVLRTYYERNISASVSARETGINIKTVTKYYMIWSDEIAKASDADFISRVRQEREQIILGYDVLIIESYKSLDTIKSEIANYNNANKPISRWLIDKKTQIIKEISNLYEKNGSFALKMTPDETIKEKVEEMMVKYRN